MSADKHPQLYVQHLKTGPFPGQVDPWAESGRYFKQIHAGMIGNLADRLIDPLLEMGYLLTRETSLMIAEGRQPDIGIEQKRSANLEASQRWNYEAAAGAALAEPGIAVEWETAEQDGIAIRDFQTGALVTVIEVVSPRNKSDRQDLESYQEYRERLLRIKGVNVVEIDLTRSVKRLLDKELVATYAYHVAVYLPDSAARIVGMDYSERLKRIAIPLRGEVIAADVQDVYDHAYQSVSVAAQIYNAGQYREDTLPFPTLLTESQRRDALEKAQLWIEKLEQLTASQ
jgi:hypothetical protein